jgi:hypothetical protein
MSIARIAVDLVARTAQFRQDMHAARGPVRDFASEVVGAQATMARFAGGLRTLGGSLALGGIMRLVNSEAAAVEQTMRLADEIGATYNEIAALQLAAEDSGVAVDSIAKGMARLNRTLGDSKKAKEIAEAFKAAGTSVGDMAGGGGIDQLGQIADRLAAIEDPAQRAALGFKIFGRQYSDMLPIIREGNKGLEDARKRLDAFGLGMSDRDLATMKRVDDAMDDMAAANKAMKKEAALSLSWLGKFLARYAEGGLAMFRLGWEGFRGKGGLADLKQEVDFQRKAVEEARKLRQETEATAAAMERMERGAELKDKFRTAREELEATRAELDDLFRNGAIDQETYARAWGKAKEEFIESDEALRSVKNALENSITPWQKYRREVQNVADAFYRGDINLKQFRRASQQLRKEFESSDPVLQESKRVLESLQSPAQRYGAEVARLAELYREGGLLANEYAAAVRKAAGEYRRDSGAQAVIDDTRTPLEKMTAEYGKLRRFLKDGLIDASTFRRALRNMAEEWREQAGGIKESREELDSFLRTGEATAGNSRLMALGIRAPGAGGMGGGNPYIHGFGENIPRVNIPHRTLPQVNIPHAGGDVGMVNGVATYGRGMPFVPAMAGPRSGMSAESAQLLALLARIANATERQANRGIPMVAA